MNSPEAFLEITLGEYGVVDFSIKLNPFNAHLRLMPFFLLRGEYPEVRDPTFFYGLNLLVLHCANQNVVLIVEFLAESDITLGIDPRDDFAPHHGRILMRNIFDHVGFPIRMVLYSVFDPQEAVVVIISLAGFANQVVIGEVATTAVAKGVDVTGDRRCKRMKKKTFFLLSR